MSVRLLGLGTSAPDGRLDQSRAAEIACALTDAGERERSVRALFRRAGVERRASVLADANGGLPYYQRGGVPTTGERMETYSAHAPALAHDAAAAALADAGVDPGRCTHLVTVSCTGFDAPGVDLALVGSLGLDRHIRRTHVGFMGCHGAINGLAVARAYAGAQPDACALVVCVELCTLHFRASVEHGAMVANALFADGAAAAVIGRGEAGRELVSCSSVVVPGTRDEMGWVIGDTGFEMTLGTGVPAALAHASRGWVDGWLARHGLTRGDVAGWAVHPGGPRVLDEIGAALELDDGAVGHSRAVLREHGNMSSGTVLYILERMRAVEGPIVTLAFGPGLAGEGALFV